MTNSRSVEHLSLRTMFAILAFTVLTIWSQRAWPLGITQCAIWLLCIFALSEASSRLTAWPAMWIPGVFFVAAIWGWVQIVIDVTADRYATANAALQWMTLSAFFITAALFLRTFHARLQFRLFSIHFGAFVALWAILQAFSAGGKILWFYRSESDYPMGPFLSYDHFCTYILLLGPLSLWEAFQGQRRSVYFGSLSAIMYASVMVSGSRAGVILLALELLTLTVLLARTQKKGGNNSATIMVIIIVTVCVIVGTDRLIERVHESTLVTVNFRRDVWAGSLEMLRTRPWTGSGLGLPTWTSTYPAFAVFDPGTFVNAAHSDWLQWADEGGIFFVLLLIFFAGRVVILSTRSIWGMGAVFAFLHSCVDFPLQRMPILLWLVAIAAALETSHADAVHPHCIHGVVPQ